METSWVVVRDLLFSPLWKSKKTKSALLYLLPSRFKGWREVLHAEIGDPSKRNGMEEDILAWLKFLKANARRASVESVLDYLHHIKAQGQKPDSVRASLRW
jgi:hypothetical protein